MFILLLFLSISNKKIKKIISFILNDTTHICIRKLTISKKIHAKSESEMFINNIILIYYIVNI